MIILIFSMGVLSCEKPAVQSTPVETNMTFDSTVTVGMISFDTTIVCVSDSATDMMGEIQIEPPTAEPARPVQR